MTRDDSQDSNVSLATAPPAVPDSASLSLFPNITEPYIYIRPGPTSTQVANPRGLSFGRSNELVGSPVTLVSLVNNRLAIPGGGSVQFGLMEPIAIPDARVRANAARERSAERQNK